MARDTTHRVSRETVQDRLRMASTGPGVAGLGVTSSRAARQVASGIEKLANHTIEDGIYGDEEKDAFSEFHNAILFDIDRQIVEFVEHIENEVRPARWAANRAANQKTA